jgi:Ras-related protein Rab-6A
MSNIHHKVTPRAKYKLVFVGNSSVGKTSIISRFMYDHFDTNYDATIGIDFLAKTHTVDGKTVRLQLWDTAGQERFRSLIPSYIRDSSVAVVVYAVDNRNSFDKVDKWIEEVREERDDEVLLVLVGNKIDIHQKQVSSHEGAEKARYYRAIFIETSAKTGTNVHELFDQIALQLPAERPTTTDERKGTVRMNQTSEQVDGGCCKV